MLRRDMQTQTKYVIGVDFGSDSVRCLIVGTAGKHGKIDPVGTDEIDPVKTA